MADKESYNRFLPGNGRAPVVRAPGWPERWATMAAGGLLTAVGVSRRTLGGAVVSGVGAGLVYFGAKGLVREGRSHTLQPGVNTLLRTQRSTTILDSPGSLFERWRSIEQLPGMLSHAEAVRDVGGGLSIWVIKVPYGRSLEVKARIAIDDDRRILTWRAVEGSDIGHFGSVRFSSAPGDRGAVVRVILEYEAGDPRESAALGLLALENHERRLAGDLRRFKQMVECGEAPTTRGQPHGRGRRTRLVAMKLARRSAQAAVLAQSMEADR